MYRLGFHEKSHLLKVARCSRGALVSNSTTKLFWRKNYSQKKDGDNNGEMKDELSERPNEDLSFPVKLKTSPSAPAPISPDLGIESLMTKSKKPYIPKLKHERLTYDYPGLPNEDEFTKHSNTTKKPKTVTRWTRHVPKILTAIVVLWGAYSVKVWFFQPEKGSDSKELLDPYEFHKFVITHKQQIDDDHYLIEMRPKFKNWQYSYYAHYENKSIWNGDRIWSVEIKQPEIMVLRAYTPLPLYFMKSEKTRSGEKEPLLRVIDNDADDYDKGGVMTLYIKKYSDGEVSRYIVDKKVGDEIDVRGPHVEYKFPFHPLNQLHTRPVFKDLPSKIEAESLLATIKREKNIPDVDNMTFYAAGTGIAPILQVLFSKNPYRGFTTVHYSAKKPTELGPLERYLFFLEKLDRIKLVKHIDTLPRDRLSKKDVKAPVERNYVSPMRQEIENSSEPSENAEETNPTDSLKLRMAILDDPRETIANNSKLAESERAHRYENALQQAAATSREKKADSALSLVCGPNGYVEYVAGGKLMNTNEQGPVTGLLGAKGWDNKNVFKL